MPGAAIPKRVDEMVLMNLLRPIFFESIDPSVKTATIFACNYYSYRFSFQWSLSDISKFWNGQTLPNDFFGAVRISPIPGAVPRRLGSFPFWRGEEKFLDAMESIYGNASAVGLRVFLVEQVNPVRKDGALTRPQ
jgi:hypothetical protein